MNDVWVCSICHSLNRQRDKRCYKCSALQIDSSADVPGSGRELRVSAAIANRAVGGYHSSWLLATLASVLILLVAGLGVVILVADLGAQQVIRQAVTAILNGATYDPNALASQADLAAGIAVARLAFVAAAVIVFGAWLSRVIANIPALGGGVPATSPIRAFVYTLIPLWNLIKVPGMLQDALYRVEPRAGGFFMVSGAWFGLVGSWIVSFVGVWIISIGLVQAIVNAPTLPAAVRAVEGSLDQAFALSTITSAMVAIGAIILVMLIAQVERRCAARDAEIRAAVLVPAEA